MHISQKKSAAGQDQQRRLPTGHQAKLPSGEAGRAPRALSGGLMQLQRAVGNRAVGQMLRRQTTPPASPSRLIQRTAAENLQIFQGIPGAAADGSYTTEGSKGQDIKDAATGDFIVTGKGGTWHHIFPRNLLKSHLENISKYLVFTKGKEAQMTSTATSHAAIVNMAGSFSMKDTGVLAKPAHYYWKNGNGYVGVRSDNRTDDPGSLVEHDKPASMSSAKYNLPRKWGKEIEKLSGEIGKLGSLSNISELATVDTNLNKLAGNVMSMSWELDGTPYRSVDAKENKDWKRTATGHAWGADQKNYELVK